MTLGRVNAVIRALSLLAVACLSAPAGAAFDRLYVFGDSLSDVGNVQAITTAIGPLLVPPTPGPYYFGGRFSNGPNFVEMLSEGLGLGAVRPSFLGGSDYAHGGALATGTPPPASLVVKDVDDQVTQYLARHAGSPTALYVVYAGSNDVITDPTSGAAAAASLATSIGRLYDAGARNVLAPNLPPLGLVPRNNADPARKAAADAASAQFNATLAAALGRLEADHPDLTLYRLDVAGLFADLVGDPAAFGLANVTDAAAPGLEPGARTYDMSRLVANPDQYLFWDDLHPSRAGHALLGRAALAVVPEPCPLAPILLAALGMLRRRRHGAGAHRTDAPG
jgi:phospholipase/lecithinase/hemolysin